MTISERTQEHKINISPAIFRAYDIRGIVGETLTLESVKALGQVIGTLALEAGDKSVVIGRDGRVSSPELAKVLAQGILSSGADVIDIDMVPTPILYYSTFVLETRSGVMLTGSHNPPEYNGLKIMVAGRTLAEHRIKNLYQRIISNQVSQGLGALYSLEMIERYIRHIIRDVPLARSLKVVVDCGNGAAGHVAPRLFRDMGCDVTELYCEVDGLFPNHHPDPSQVENLQDLIAKVKEIKADIGIAFDGDGDRLGIVTSQGEIIWPDRQMMLYARSVLADNPGAKIIYDVKCSNHLAEVIRASGGEPIMWKTGHSLIKAKLAETHAILAGEMSGHIFFKDRWYGVDDAIYAAARLLQILSKTEKDSDALFKEIPNSVNTPELKVFIADEEKFLFMDYLSKNANFSEASEISTIDGLRVSFPEGWGIVRPSNTTPCLVLRFEAKSEEILQKIQQTFREVLLAAKPDLVLSF